RAALLAPRRLREDPRVPVAGARTLPRGRVGQASPTHTAADDERTGDPARQRVGALTHLPRLLRFVSFVSFVRFVRFAGFVVVRRALAVEPAAVWTPRIAP